MDIRKMAQWMKIKKKMDDDFSEMDRKIAQFKNKIETMPIQVQGDPGMTVYDKETEEFVQVTKQDIKKWVKEAVVEKTDKIYINEEAAQRLANAEPVKIKKSNIPSDLDLPKEQRIKEAQELIQRWQENRND